MIDSPEIATEQFDGELVVIVKAEPVVNESFNNGEKEIEASSCRDTASAKARIVGWISLALMFWSVAI